MAAVTRGWKLSSHPPQVIEWMTTEQLCWRELSPMVVVLLELVWLLDVMINPLQVMVTRPQTGMRSWVQTHLEWA